MWVGCKALAWSLTGLQELNVESSQQWFADDGIEAAEVAKLTGLKRLCLGGNSIGDKGRLHRQH